MIGAGRSRKKPGMKGRLMTGLHMVSVARQSGHDTPRAAILRKRRCRERHHWPSRIRPG